MWILDLIRVRKLRREHDRLYALCGRLADDLKKANRNLEEAKARNCLFSECMRRANAVWMKAHPDSRIWPDGADNIVWLMERLAKYERGLRDAVERLGEAHVQYLNEPLPAWRTHIPKHLLELYNETHAGKKGC